MRALPNLTAIFALSLAVLGAACGDEGTTPPGDTAQADVMADAATDTATDAPTDTGADADAVADTVADTDAVADTVADTDAVADTVADTDAVADTVADTDAAPDTMTDVGPGSCELWSDACGDGQWCWMFPGTGDLSCGAAGTIAVGDVCTETDGPEPCVAGAVCVAVAATEARCLALCDDAHPCVGAGQICEPQYQGLGDGTLGLCVGADCTPPADGCPAGQKCIPSGGGESMTCVPAGTVPVGGACSDSNPCVAGAICGPMTCLALCDGASDCPATDEHCVWPVPKGAWGYCGYGACDPVLQDGCAQGEACYIGDTLDGSTICWDAGAVPVGGACTDLSSLCVSGADCIEEVAPSGDTTYTCRAFCDADHPCDPGLTCRSAPKVPSLHFCLP